MAVSTGHRVDLGKSIRKRRNSVPGGGSPVEQCCLAGLLVPGGGAPVGKCCLGGFLVHGSGMSEGKGHERNVLVGVALCRLAKCLLGVNAWNFAPLRIMGDTVSICYHASLLFPTISQVMGVRSICN